MKKAISFCSFLFVLLIIIVYCMINLFTLKVDALQAPGIQSGSTYWIVNAHSGLVLQAGGTSDGSNVYQNNNTNSLSQKWKLTYIPSNSFYLITPLSAPDMYLAAYPTPISNETNVCIKSSTGNGGLWKITCNDDDTSSESNSCNHNYIISSKFYPTYALTVSNGSINTNANVFMYTYSFGNSCNDEWILVPTSGDTINSVFIDVQKDYSYTQFIQSDPSETYRVMADVGKPFYRKWHIAFRNHYGNIAYVPADDCAMGYNNMCQTGLCGSQCENNSSNQNHDKNFDRNAYYAWTNYFSNTYDIDLVLNYVPKGCHKNNSGNHSDNALGMASSANKIMVKQNRGHMLNVRVIQHELTHCFGVSDNSCATPSTSNPCIMNGGFDNNYSYNIESIWCSECEQNFDRTMH